VRSWTLTLLGAYLLFSGVCTSVSAVNQHAAHPQNQVRAQATVSQPAGSYYGAGVVTYQDSAGVARSISMTGLAGAAAGQHVSVYYDKDTPDQVSRSPRTNAFVLAVLGVLLTLSGALMAVGSFLGRLPDVLDPNYNPFTHRYDHALSMFRPTGI